MTTTIVVGSGSSGGPVAARLSEDEDHHVILIEAGPDYPAEADLPPALRDANAFDPQLFGHDWGLEGHPVEPPDARPPVPYLRGRLVGGSSATNGAVGQRATPEDFAAWAAAGNDEWSWERILPLYRRLERDLDFGASEIHGGAGPVPISRSRRDEWPRALQSFEAACIDRGHPVCHDANAPDATGVGAFPRNLHGTRRASSASTYLAAARGRPNLEIRGDTTVDRVLFDGRRATGVEVRRAGAGRTERVDADRVVLCAGFAKSPQILMLSGIGPAAHLRRLGIEPLVDLPVGRGLSDHPSFVLVGTSTDPAEPIWGPRAELQCTSSLGPRNDLLVVPALVDPRLLGLPVPPEVRALVLLSGALGKPSSTGHLELTSKDPSAHPRLRLNFLAEEADRRRSREVFRMVHDIATHSPFAGEIGQLVTPLPDGLDDPDRLDEHLRGAVGTSWHGTGTCRMGPREDATTVVSQRLAVHDTDGLYVADASVMPEITTSALNLTCFLIGERMADLLRA